MAIEYFRWIEEGVLAGSALPASPEDIEWLYSKKGIRAILSLEPLSNYLKREIHRRRIRYLQIGVQDFSVPSSTQINHILAFLERHIKAGMPTLVHCKAGVGRTGTVLAIYLVSTGLDVGKALTKVGGIETSVQREAVLKFAESKTKKRMFF